MAKRQLNAREILQDIRSGMDDTPLMEKYNLSAQGLHSAFNKLIAAGVLKRAELDQRTRPSAEAAKTAWKCPACGKPQFREDEECPDCGVIASRFLKQQKEKRNREEEEQIRSEKVKPDTSQQPQDYKSRVLAGIICLAFLAGLVALGVSPQDLLLPVMALVIGALVAMWVYSDAKKRGKSSGDATIWAVGTLLCCIPVLVVWLFMRPKLPLEARVIIVQPPGLCIHCGKYYEGKPRHCPNCGQMV